MVLKEGNENSSNNNEDEDHNAASGQLTGIAQDQSFVVPVDDEARRHQLRSISSQSSNTHTGSHTYTRPSAPRHLRDIVRESTERWQMQTDGADQEYFRELKSIGYQNEEVEEMMNQRGKEYHGMLRLGCKRVISSIPQIISSISHLKVLQVSAGYAHCMVLTDQGHMYAAGYNDRGQLGLGTHPLYIISYMYF